MQNMPKGKKCKLIKKLDMDLPSTSCVHLMSSSCNGDVLDSGVGAFYANMSTKKITKQKDCFVKKAEWPQVILDLVPSC